MNLNANICKLYFLEHFSNRKLNANMQSIFLRTFKQSLFSMQTFDSSGASGDVQYGRYAALLSIKGNAEGKFKFKSKYTHGKKSNAHSQGI